MFKHILAATDLVEAHDPVVAAAVQIAKQHRADLHILHVPESGQSENRLLVRHFKTGEEIDYSADYAKTLIAAIDAVYAGICSPDFDTTIRVAPGFPWEEIIRWSRQTNASMIVLGPHSGRAEEKGLVRTAGKIGSTVEGVVMRENCPVMIVNPRVRIRAGKALGEFQKILVGIDFSISCECALSFARQMADRFGATIFPFHMMPVPPYPKYSREDFEADRTAAQQRLETFCADFVKGVPHKYQIRAGALPHQEIVNAAETMNADLIVMGSHTRTKDRRWYAGSAVERTAFRSNCPVVVVTDPDALLGWDESQDASAIGRDRDRLIHVFTRKRQQ
jgi:nucleotide-binding universal stress UspA family protein